MKHPDDDALSAYIDEELDRTAMREVADHLAYCGECAAIVAAFRGFGEAIRGTVPDDSALFVQEVMDRLAPAGDLKLRGKPFLIVREVLIPTAIAALSLALIITRPFRESAVVQSGVGSPHAALIASVPEEQAPQASPFRFSIVLDSDGGAS